MDDTDQDGTKEEERKPPLSVRDAVGPTRPPRPPPTAGSPSGEAAASEEGGGASDEGSEPGEARPTPVRELMGAEGSGRGSEVPLPTRTFRHRDREWEVRVVGTTLTGQPSDPGAPLMHLRFLPGKDAPDGEAQEERELLCVGRGLDDLYEEELRELLERSRPAKKGPDGES